MTKKNTVEDNVEKKKIPIVDATTSHFYYASLNYIEVYYLISPEKVSRYLEGTNLSPVLFDNKACVSFNFHSYSSHFCNASGFTQEVELSITCFPNKYTDIIPELSFLQYLEGEEQSKTIGNYRIHVPCDDTVAIEAGKKKFGEPKFEARFKTQIPAFNNPSVSIWKFNCSENIANGNEIFSCEIDLTKLANSFSNIFPRTYYGLIDGKTIGSRWNLLSPIQTYILSLDDAKRVNLKFGKSKSQMKKDMQYLIENNSAVAIHEYRSKPIAIQGRSYWIN